jgi:hypothetical protein
MDEKWKDVLVELEALAETAGVKLPAAFEPPAEGKPAGRTQANPWLKEANKLDHLAGFLAQVNRKLTRKLEPAEGKKSSGSPSQG